MQAAARIFALLDAAFDFGDQQELWRDGVRTLFDLRNKVVHFNPEWLDLAPHPTGRSNVAPELAIYSAEEASRSVKLAVEIITTALTSPGDDSRVQEWATSARHATDYLTERMENVNRTPR